MQKTLEVMNPTQALDSEEFELQQRQREAEKQQRRRFIDNRETKTQEAQQGGRASQTDGGRGIRYLIVPMIAEELRKHDEWIASQKCAGGVAIKEFRRISSWVSVEMIAHLAVTVLLDNLGSGNNLGSTVTDITIDIGDR